jgi:hypothetical protein
MRNVYGDGQNVHNTEIQASFRNSVEALFRDDPSDLEEALEQASQEFPADLMQMVRRWCAQTETFGELGTYGDIFARVWNRVINHPHNRGDLIERLRQELEESRTVCSVGRVTRLVNTLVGYYQDINIGIGEREEMGNIVALVVNEMEEGGEEEARTEAIRRLRERGYTQEQYREFIDAII